MSAANFASRWALARVVAALLGSSSVNCVDLPATYQFACERGGPCPDAGEAVVGEPDAAFVPDASDSTDARAKDAGPTDAGRRDGGADAGRADSGVPPVDGGLTLGCGAVRTLPPNGTVEAETLANDPNVLLPQCASQGGGGPEHVYRIDLPVAVSSLWLRTFPRGQDYFDTVLVFYAETCNSVDQLACSDDNSVFQYLSEINAGALPAGTYHASVDAYYGWGPYGLEVYGTIAMGAACDPNLTFLHCDGGGVCALDGASYRCQPRKDCADGFDSDGDTQVDEDGVCTAPPQLTCPDLVAVPADRPDVVIPVHVTVDGALTGTEWLPVATDGPPSTLWALEPAQARVMTTAIGRYDVRFTALDAQRNAVTCEVPVSLDPAGVLHAELLESAGWGTFGMRLTLLSPVASHWADGPQVCLAPECTGRRWGEAATGDDPSGYGHWTPTYHQSLYVPQPQQGLRYSLGVQLSDPMYTMTPIVRVFCRGQLFEFGPVTLDAAANVDSAPFWKVADIEVGDSTCTVTPLGTQAAPLIVPYLQARMTR